MQAIVNQNIIGWMRLNTNWIHSENISSQENGEHVASKKKIEFQKSWALRNLEQKSRDGFNMMKSNESHWFKFEIAISGKTCNLEEIPCLMGDAFNDEIKNVMIISSIKISEETFLIS